MAMQADDVLTPSTEDYNLDAGAQDLVDCALTHINEEELDVPDVLVLDDHEDDTSRSDNLLHSPGTDGNPDNLLDSIWSHFDSENDLDVPNVLSLSDDSDDEDNIINTPPSVDPLEEFKTSARNGENSVSSTVSQFVGILSRSAISGPRHLKASNLKNRATKIGSGSQFTVFREKPGVLAYQDTVVKRVNVPLTFENGEGTFAQGAEYRSQLRSLELEVLSLCNPILRNHRNIVHLIAWGYDYPQPDTPLPILFMEAALMPLKDFLQTKTFDEALRKEDWKGYNIKYQLSLDIVSGVEALHRLGIVHGDLKPENVLVFRDYHPDVPFCAKLSDFGVCIDMENTVNPLTVDDYVGTKAWLAPELANQTVSNFKPEMMLRFDAYSLGLVLVSILLCNGNSVNIPAEGHGSVDTIIQDIRQRSLPTAIKNAFCSSVKQLLDPNPWTRALPNADMLNTQTVVYASWYVFLSFPPLYI